MNAMIIPIVKLIKGVCCVYIRTKTNRAASWGLNISESPAPAESPGAPIRFRPFFLLLWGVFMFECSNIIHFERTLQIGKHLFVTVREKKMKTLTPNRLGVVA